MEDKQEGSSLNKKTLFLFGLTGAGKSYLAKHFSITYGFYHYEGDDDITPSMKQAIENKTHFTDEMRNEFFEIVVNKILELQKIHENIVISQGLYKNSHRKYLLEKIPNLRLVWVKASEEVLMARIKVRGGMEITPEYARSIQANFEKPEMTVIEIENEGDLADAFYFLQGI